MDRHTEKARQCIYHLITQGYRSILNKILIASELHAFYGVYTNTEYNM